MTLSQSHLFNIEIQFKVLLFVFKALNDLAPTYIAELLVRKPQSAWSHRSDNQHLLIVPRSQTVRYGDRNIRHNGPWLWNELPTEMRSCDSIEAFNGQLKILLFKEAYDDL